jgi:hypothetical protein
MWYDVDYIALALLVVKDDNVDSNILKDVNEKENNMLNDLSTGSVPQSDGKKLYIIITSSLNRSFKSL